MCFFSSRIHIRVLGSGRKGFTLYKSVKPTRVPLEFYSMKVFTKTEQSPARDLLMTVHILEIKY